MGQYFARIVRALVVAGLGFGGGAGLLIFIAMLVASQGKQESLVVAFRAAVVLGLSFGLILSAVLLLMDLTSRLFAAKGTHREIWELVQTRIMDFEGSLKDLKRCCREALMSVPDVKSISDDDEQKMSASIGASWKSAGEEIIVTILPVDETHWRASCVSKPVATNIAFDYAKNFENVEAWKKNMESLMKGPFPA